MAPSTRKYPRRARQPPPSPPRGRRLPRRTWPVAVWTSDLSTSPSAMGSRGNDISAIETLLRTQSPIAATLGATSCFPPSATREVAVIIATIECPELHALHQRLGEVIEFVEPTHEYEPHVTVAYVRPEVAEKYVGNQITAGHTFVITEVVIRTQSREETIVALNG